MTILLIIVEKENAIFLMKISHILECIPVIFTFTFIGRFLTGHQLAVTVLALQWRCWGYHQWGFLIHHIKAWSLEDFFHKKIDCLLIIYHLILVNFQLTNEAHDKSRWKPIGWPDSACTRSTWRTTRCVVTLPGWWQNWCTSELDLADC